MTPYLPQCDRPRQHVRLDPRAEGPAIGHDQVLHAVSGRKREGVISVRSVISVMIVGGRGHNLWSACLSLEGTATKCAAG